MAGFGSVNVQVLIGRLGQDVSLTYTPGGHSIAKFTLATEHSFKKGETWEKETTWHNIIVWGKLAEFAHKYLKKGQRAYVSGRTEQQSWEKDGQKFYKTQVVAAEVQALDHQGGKDKAAPPMPSHPAQHAPDTGIQDVPF